MDGISAVMIKLNSFLDVIQKAGNAAQSHGKFCPYCQSQMQRIPFRREIMKEIAGLLAALNYLRFNNFEVNEREFIERRMLSEFDKMYEVQPDETEMKGTEEMADTPIQRLYILSETEKSANFEMWLILVNIEKGGAADHGHIRFWSAKALGISIESMEGPEAKYDFYQPAPDQTDFDLVDRQISSGRSGIRITVDEKSNIDVKVFKGT